MFDNHKNLAISQVAVAPSPATSGTSLTVLSGDGSIFPTPPFNATVWPYNTIPTPVNAEIVRVTAIVGDVLTLLRTQEGTTAKAITTKFQIANTVTVKTITDIEGAIISGVPDATTTVKGKALLGAAGGAATFESDALKATIAGDLAGVGSTATNPVLKNVQKVFNVLDYGAKADAKLGNATASITTGSSTLTVSDGTFTSADIGKGITIIGAGNAGADRRVTISGVASSTSITLSGAAQTTVTNASYYYGTQLATPLQNAINAATAAGGGRVYIPAGKYFNNLTTVTPASYVEIAGAGKDATIIYGGVAGNYMISFTSTATINYSSIRDMTFDVMQLTNGSAVQYYYANNCTLERVRFRNGGAGSAGGFLAKFGVSNAGTDTFIGIDNKVIDCDFDTHQGILEMLLVFNQKGMQIIRPRFKNKTDIGPMLGLWQKCYDTYIEDPDFRDSLSQQPLYYSYTCDNTTVNGMYVENCAGGLTGGNTSDFGEFGATQIYNLMVSNYKFIGGVNSTGAAGMKLGSVKDAKLSNIHIEKAQIGIVIDSRGGPNTPTNQFTITNFTIKNCNQTNDVHILHPGILIGGTGANSGVIANGQIYDDQATKTQRYPIVFNGAYTFDNIKISRVRLLADTANSGTSIALNNSAVLGSGVNIRDNWDYSGTNPAQSSLDGLSQKIINVAAGTNSTDGVNKAQLDAASSITPSATPTVQGKVLQTRFNVRDYGAVGDGVANDYPAFLACSSAAIAAGYPIYAPKGVYKFNSQLNLNNDNVYILGDGAGLTRFVNNIAGNSIIQIGNASGPTIRSNIIVEGITFDLNATSQSWGMQISWCKNVIVRDCNFINPATNSFSMLYMGMFSGQDSTYPSNNFLIDNCLFDYNNVNSGWEAVTLGYSRNIRVRDCTFLNKPGTFPGLLNYASDDVLIQRNRFEKAFCTINGRGPTVFSNNIVKSGQCFIYNAHNVVVDSNSFFGTAQDAADSRPTGVKVLGNYYDNTSTEVPFYVTIPYVWSCQNIVISNNEFSGSNGEAISSKVFTKNSNTYLSASELTITGNTIQTSWTDGIHAYANYIVATDNRAYNNNQLNDGSAATNFMFGAKYGIFSNNQSYDNQTTPTISRDFTINNQYVAQIPTQKWMLANNDLGVTSATHFFNGGYGTTQLGNVTINPVTGSPYETNVLLGGRSGGQTVKGGTAASENLTLTSTLNVTKGKVIIGTSAYDETNNRLGIGTATPSTALQVVGTATATTFAGSGASLTSIPETAVTNLVPDLAAKATDTLVVHLAGTETISGPKTFSVPLNITAAANAGDPALRNQEVITSTEAYSTQPGAGIIFRNQYNSSNAVAGMGGIAVYKENATDGDFAAYLGLYTRNNGGSVSERFRITSGGLVGIGKTPTTPLDVNGTITGTDGTLGTVRGSTASGGTLNLSSTSNATKGQVLLGTTYYDEANNRLGVATTVAPEYTLDANSPTNAITSGTIPSIVAMRAWRNGTTTGDLASIGLNVSGTGLNNTAMISAERTGASAQGKMHLSTKASTTNGAALNIAVTVDQNQNVGIKTQAPTSTLQVAGSFATAFSAKTAAYSLTASDSVVTGDTTTAVFSITLPTAVGITGRQYTIKRLNGGTNLLTVATTSSQTIDGATSYTGLSVQYKYVILVSDGANWIIVGGN